jgi:hypothetical protein
VHVALDFVTMQGKEYYLKRKALRLWKSGNDRLDEVQGPHQEMLSLLHYLTVSVSTSHVILAAASVCHNRKKKTGELRI